MMSFDFGTRSNFFLACALPFQDKWMLSRLVERLANCHRWTQTHTHAEAKYTEVWLLKWWIPPSHPSPPLVAEVSTQRFSCHHALPLQPITDTSLCVLRSTSEDSGQADSRRVCTVCAWVQWNYSQDQVVCACVCVCLHKSLGVSALKIDEFTIWKCSLALWAKNRWPTIQLFNSARKRAKVRGSGGRARGRRGAGSALLEVHVAKRGISTSGPFVELPVRVPGRRRGEKTARM